MAGNGNKIDSNFTGLRFTEEVFGKIGVLPGEQGNPGSPEWNVIEPNSYGDFGSQVSMVARAPISAGRQREKGVVTDVDATAGANIDFTQDNFYSLLQGFFFADWRAASKVGGAGELTGVDAAADEYEAASGLDVFAAGDLIFAKGFTNPSNNGMKRVSTAASGALGIVGSLVAETPPVGATVQRVGVRAGSGDFNVTVSGDFPTITSSTYDFTDLGLVAGQWVYVGGDAANTSFVGANNNGFARVRTVTANALSFDKTQNTMTAETGTGLTIELFVGDLIRNENDPTLIKCRSFQFERSLSSAGYEYVKGCVGNTFTLNVTTADKINADVAFIGTDTDTREFASRKAGTFPGIATSSTAFNTSSDFSRIRTAEQDTLATPLFAFITEMTLTINNNVSPAKAIGTLGAFDMNVGDFVAEGNVTAYFSDVSAIQAVRNNADVTLDFALAKNNAGWVFDVPLLTLGEGRLNVEKDAAITIPVSIGAARDPVLNTSLQGVYFAYLPTLAEA